MPSEFSKIPPPDDLLTGSELSLSFRDAESRHEPPVPPIQIPARITHAFTPFTMAAVVQVTLSLPSSHSHIPSNAILKLYDRRCLCNIRQSRDDDKPLDAKKELKYREYLESIASSGVAPQYDAPMFFGDDEVGDGMFEAYAQYYCDKIFAAEVAAYARLEELQGKQIASLYGTVEVEVPPLIDEEGKAIPIGVVKGILVEYIPSMTLRDFITTWPSRDPPLPVSTLISVCQRAVDFVDRISDFDILNDDVRVDNILVRNSFLQESALSESRDAQSEPEITPFPCVIIDLGSCRMRRSDESDEEWRVEKCGTDETGAVGCVASKIMERTMGKVVWDYQRSERYYRQVEDEEEVEEEYLEEEDSLEEDE